MLSPKPWRAEAALRLVLGLLVCMSLGSLLSLLLKGDPDASFDEKHQLLGFLVMTLSFHGAILVLVHFFLREHQVGWVTGFGLNSRRAMPGLLLAIVVMTAVIPVTMYLGKLSHQLMTSLDVEPVAQRAVRTLQTTVAVGPQLYFGLIAVAIAPLAEEALFRGILYPLIKQTGQRWLALWLSQVGPFFGKKILEQRGYRWLALWSTSLLFAAVHINLMAFIPLTFLAIVLALLYEATDNLLVPIFAHSLFNLANFFWLIADDPMVTTGLWFS